MNYPFWDVPFIGSGWVIGGIAIFDHPENLRYPTTWHVRNYGLFTANQWGIHDFTGDWSQRGDLTLEEGDALTFYLHGHELNRERGKLLIANVNLIGYTTWRTAGEDLRIAGRNFIVRHVD